MTLLGSTDFLEQCVECCNGTPVFEDQLCVKHWLKREEPKYDPELLLEMTHEQF